MNQSPMSVALLALAALTDQSLGQLLKIKPSWYDCASCNKDIPPGRPG